MRPEDRRQIGAEEGGDPQVVPDGQSPLVRELTRQVSWAVREAW